MIQAPPLGVSWLRLAVLDQIDRMPLTDEQWAVDHALDRAIRFLSAAIESSGHNPKPVVLHSVRVGLVLRNLGYRSEVPLAGILHDVLEDTNVSAEEIIREFGPEVARLVQANSFDDSIEDWDEQYIEGFQRCCLSGPDAVRVKAADVLDNVPIYDLESLRKPKFFLELSKPIIGAEQLWTMLDEAIKEQEVQSDR